MVVDKLRRTDAKTDIPAILPEVLGQCLDPGMIAKAVVGALEKEPAGSVIGFYGCGAVARILIQDYAQPLRAYTIFFIETRPAAEDFSGHARVAPYHPTVGAAARIFILSTTHGDAMVSNLKGIRLEKISRVEDTIARLPGASWETFYRDSKKREIQGHVEKIKRLAGDGKPVIFFALPGVVNEALKLMYFLKKKGRHLVLFTAGDRVNHLPLAPYQELGYFDHLVVAPAYTIDLLCIAEQTPVSFIHFDVGVGPGLPVAQVIVRSPVPVFARYLDIKELVFRGDDERWRQHAGDQYYAHEKDAAAIIFTRSDGLIFKDSPEAMAALSKQYHHKPRQLYFPSYPAKTFAPPLAGQPKYSALDGRIHLVYCGLLFNAPGDKLRAFFHSILEAAQLLARQDICLTVYNGLDSSGEGFEEYVRLDRELDHFHYKFAQRPDEIGTVMSRYDFGFFCFDQTKNPDSDLYKRTTFGSKIFAFLEAGLPIIVSSETGFMAQFVEDNNIGVAVPWNDMGRVKEIIQATDWAIVHRSIEAKKASWELEKRIDELIDFYSGQGVD